MMRRVSLALGIVAVVLGGAGVGHRWTSPEPESAAPGLHLVVIDPDPDLGLLPVGSTTEFAYRITNTGSWPVRIVGFEGDACGSTWCVTPKFRSQSTSQSVTIPPGETIRFLCELKITRPGPIDWTMGLIVNDNGIHKVRLTVRGIAVAAEGPQNATPNP